MFGGLSSNRRGNNNSDGLGDGVGGVNIASASAPGVGGGIHEPRFRNIRFITTLNSSFEPLNSASSATVSGTGAASAASAFRGFQFNNPSSSSSSTRSIGATTTMNSSNNPFLSSSSSSSRGGTHRSSNDNPRQAGSLIRSSIEIPLDSRVLCRIHFRSTPGGSTSSSSSSSSSSGSGSDQTSSSASSRTGVQPSTSANSSTSTSSNLGNLSSLINQL